MKSSHGQILPLALVLILIMALFWIMVINVGKLVKDRIQLQIAADTSAQTACAIRARGLNAIGRMNSWLGTPGLGIGTPKAAWWPDAARLQKYSVTIIRDLQEAYNRAYGGGRAAELVRGLARRQGADGIYVPAGSYSLRLQRNRGPIWYLSTRHIIVYGVPVPVPFLPVPQLMEEDPSTKRWYEQGPRFYKKSLRLYVYRRAHSPFNGPFPLGRNLLGIQMPDLYAVAAARVYNTKGPMFPKASETEGFFGGVAAQKAYKRASQCWQSQLVPVGGIYEH